MRLLDDTQIKRLAASGKGFGWPEVVVHAIACLSSEERRKLGQTALASPRQWFEENRSLVDSWRQRLDIRAWHQGPRKHKRYHPASINLVAILLSRKDSRSPTAISRDPTYLRWDEQVRNHEHASTFARGRNWFRAVEDVEERYAVATRLFPDATAQEAYTKISNSLISDWLNTSPNDNYSDDIFNEIAWIALKSIIETTEDSNYTIWLANTPHAAALKSFKILAAAYFSIALAYTPEPGHKHHKALQIMFPYSLEILDQGVVSPPDSDLLLFNLTARYNPGIGPIVRSSFSLSHSEISTTEQARHYYRSESLTVPLSADVNKVLDKLFSTPVQDSEATSTCNVTQQGGTSQLFVQMSATDGAIQLRIDSQTSSPLDLWRVQGLQRNHWYPQNNLRSSHTTDFYIGDISRPEQHYCGLRLRPTYNGLQFVTIPRGEYLIGDRLGRGTPDELPLHKLILSEFAISIMPVTIGMYRRFISDMPGWARDGAMAAICAQEEPEKNKSFGYLRDWMEMEELSRRVAVAAEEDDHFSANDLLAVEKMLREGWELCGFDELPVFAVPWRAAAAFCNWLSECFGLPPAYDIDARGVATKRAHSTGFRLPTEAEWETAASCGGRYAYGFSDEFDPLQISWAQNPGWTLEELANNAVAGRSRIPRPAILEKDSRRSRRNEPCRTRYWWELGRSDFGLYQTLGNVWEWTEDIYKFDAYRGRSDVMMVDPCVTPRADTTQDRDRVIRGGSFVSDEVALRSSKRGHAPETRMHFIGFRVARSIA